MLKYLQTKMFHVGNNPTMDQKQFGDFRSCLSIFINSTKLQKNRKRETKKQKGRTYLAPATRPTCRPSPVPRQRAACRPGRQARCSTASTAWVPRTCSPPRRLPRPANAVNRPPSLPRTPQSPPLLSSSSPSRSPAMTDATTAVPTS